MVDVTSAIIGVSVVSALGTALYAAYLKGGTDATSPESVVDLNAIFNYRAKASALNSLDDEVDDDNSGQ